MKFLLNMLKQIAGHYVDKKDSLLKKIFTISAFENKIILLVLLIYCFDFVSFARYYFLRYPTDVYPQRFFANTYKDVTDYIETNTGEPKVVFTNASYIFYFLSEKLDPFEANIPQNGTKTYWKYVFELPEEMETNAIYVIRETTEDYIKEYTNKLEEYSYEKYESGMFRCYYKK